MENKAYDQFPLPLVLLCVAVNMSIYISGAYLMAQLGKTFMILYVLYCLWLEIRLYAVSCRHCYYYGKLCAFGKGKLCALLFKKGSPDLFLNKKINCASLIPDFLVPLIPLAVGGFFLVQNFSWPRLIFIIVLAILAFPVTGYLRVSISCKYCKQKETGCPSVQFFAENRKKA